MSSRTQGETFQTDLYSWGDNSYQQLGYKTNYTPESGYTASSTPQAIETLSRKPIVQIAAGASHTMALTVDGLVYCWGRNNSYQCGNGSNTFNSAPLVVEKLKGKKITQIACGNSHSIAVTDSDEVYVWGSNCYYQLSIVHYKIPDQIRSPFLEGKRVAKVACGANFTTILTTSGEILSWGSNTKGELGIGTFCNTPSPQPVRLEARCVWIDCGFSHSTAVTADGRLYTWGSNDNSQLGFTQHHLNMSTPQLVSCLIDKAIKKAVCGSFYTMCITEDGKLYAWGCNTSYELGLGHTNRVSSPQLVYHLQDRVISNVYCGKAHTIATTEEGLVYGWGANSYNQIVSSSVAYVPIPKLLSHLHAGGEILSLCCGDFQTFMLTELIEPSTFQMDFENALNNPQYSDVTFIAQGKKIYAHKFVLLTRCEHFVHVFKHQMRESQTNEIKLDETSYPAAYAFLEYLYTDKLNLATEYAVELYNLANMYNVERLKKLCDQSIRKNLTLNNCVVVFRAAYCYRVETIAQYCANFILTHLGELVRTNDFQDLSQEELLAIFKQVPQHCSIDL